MFLELNKKKCNAIAAIEDSGKKITYGEICDYCEKTKTLIPERSIVFILCKNTIGALKAYISCVENNSVPLMLSAAIDKELLNSLLNTYKPQYIWVPVEKNYDLRKMCEEDNYVLYKTENKKYEIYKELELLMTTSGSTGSPKLVRYKKGNLEANAENVAKAFQWNEKEKPLCDLAMNYTMGLNVINTHLYVGATLILTTYNIMSREFWKVVKEQKVTNFTGVPFSYELMFKLKFEKMELPYLKTLAEGGGKLTDDMFRLLTEYAEEHGKRFIATFGTTETAARMAFLPEQYTKEKVGSIGKAIPNGKLFLLDQEGKEIVDSNVEGELAYQGPNVTLGYAICKEDLKKGDEFLGEYHTGDIAKKDEDGFFYIVGRKNRFIKLLGYRVSLDQCERLIKTKFSIECACSGNDKKMYIYIVDATKEKEVLKYISEKTGMFQSLFEVRIIESIPKNESGKIMYKKLEG